MQPQTLIPVYGKARPGRWDARVRVLRVAGTCVEAAVGTKVDA